MSPLLSGRDYFLQGTPSDQLNKMVSMPTATFGRTKPVSASTIVQLAVATGETESPQSSSAAYWRGPYRGQIDGELELRTFWSTADPEAARSGDVVVTVFGDTGRPGEPDALLGRRVAKLLAGVEPTYNLTRLTVHGIVDRMLTIQVAPRYINGGADLRASYGSGAYPAGFALRPVPAGSGGALASRPRSEPLDRKPTLAVQAVEIGHRASEPTLGVAPDGKAYFAAQANNLGTDVMRSVDGGLTWTDVSPKVAGRTESIASLDPYLYVDEKTGRVFALDLHVSCSYLVFTDDGGKTWDRNPLFCGAPVNDHQTVVAGPPPPGVEPTFYGYDVAAGGLCGGIHATSGPTPGVGPSSPRVTAAGRGSRSPRMAARRGGGPWCRTG